VVVNPGTSKVMRFDIEFEISLGRDGLENSDGFGGDLGAW
jgi:hypothetical protein